MATIGLKFDFSCDGVDFQQSSAIPPHQVAYNQQICVEALKLRQEQGN